MSSCIVLFFHFYEYKTFVCKDEEYLSCQACQSSFDSESETLTAVPSVAGCSGSRGLPVQWATLRAPNATARPGPPRRATAAAPIPSQTELAQRQVATARGSRCCPGGPCTLKRAQRALKRTQWAVKRAQRSGGMVKGAGRGGRSRPASSLWHCATQAERHQLPPQVGALTGSLSKIRLQHTAKAILLTSDEELGTRLQCSADDTTATFNDDQTMGAFASMLTYLIWLGYVFSTPRRAFSQCHVSPHSLLRLLLCRCTQCCACGLRSKYCVGEVGCLGVAQIGDRELPRVRTPARRLCWCLLLCSRCRCIKGAGLPAAPFLNPTHPPSWHCERMARWGHRLWGRRPHRRHTRPEVVSPAPTHTDNARRF